MTDVTLLRKLTEKSIFGFGKYADLAVRDVLNLRHPTYIRWCYFNLDKISFMDNILDEIKIPQDYRIEKPGKNKELGDKLEEEIFGRISHLFKYILHGTMQKQEKRYRLGGLCKDKLAFKRGVMQSKNQGHTKIKY